MRFLLDTDTCAYAMNGHATVLAHLQSHRRTEIAISVVTEAELRFGAAKRAPKFARTVDAFLLAIEIVEFTSRDAAEYADIRAKLEDVGTPIGELDTLIAAHARAQHLVLVTNNEREFKRVAGLRIENWTR